MTLFSSRSAAPTGREPDRNGENPMSELKNYDVEINGWPTTVKLTDAEARERGLTEAVPAKAKARATGNKSRTPANKGSGAANKGADAGNSDAGDGNQGAEVGDQGTGSGDAGQGQ